MIVSRKSVNINYIDNGISDHKLLLCSCEVLKPPPIYRQLQIRRWNFLDTEKFISGLKLSPLSAATNLDVDSASDLYNFTLSRILDKMIPFEPVRIHERPDPWFDRECRTSKCLKRSLEKIYMRTKSENDFATWLDQKKLYKRLCRPKRRDYWNNKLSDPKSKTTNIWSHIKSVSGLDHNVVSSYRPISNLLLLSKLAKRLVLNRVMSYLNNSNLLFTHQSAYRRRHSTETAVTKVYSDILVAVDDGELSLFVLLNPAALFGLVDHSIVLKQLKKHIWF